MQRGAGGCTANLRRTAFFLDCGFKEGADAAHRDGKVGIEGTEVLKSDFIPERGQLRSHRETVESRRAHAEQAFSYRPAEKCALRR